MSQSQPAGVDFPPAPDGRRSTSATGRAVWADAVRAVDPALADRIDGVRDWRRDYVRCVVDVTAAATRSPGAAVGTAVAGLQALRERMRFETADGSGRLGDAVAASEGPVPATSRVDGQGEREAALAVPYRGRLLEGDALLRQLDDWQARGTVEPSCAEALRHLVRTPAELDLRDRAFGVLGAAAELGPVGPLLRWGARVAAVDLPEPRLQDRLRTLGRDGAGVLELPVHDGPAGSGADLLVETPQVARWLAGAADDLPMTVGSYAYADGARHVRVAVASDAVVEHLLQGRPGTSYAELATPTDVFAVPADVVAVARERWASRGWRSLAQRPARLLSRGTLFRPAYEVLVERDDGTQVGLADVLVPQQGPNYSLAKRLQRWRAVAAVADGVLVSANVAPPTATRSVLTNRVLAAAYAGASAFGVEVFAPSTSRVLMAALLVHDVRTGPAPVRHPDDLFVASAAHGGLWRSAYALRSVFGLAAVRGLPAALRR